MVEVLTAPVLSLDFKSHLLKAHLRHDEPVLACLRMIGDINQAQLVVAARPHRRDST